MKKIILSLALTTLLISCKEETKEKIDEASKAVEAEVEQKMDTIKEKIDVVIDSTQSKTADAMQKGADKLDEAAEKMKEASKK